MNHIVPNARNCQLLFGSKPKIVFHKDIVIEHKKLQMKITMKRHEFGGKQLIIVKRIKQNTHKREYQRTRKSFNLYHGFLNSI